MALADAHLEYEESSDENPVGSECDENEDLLDGGGITLGGDVDECDEEKKPKDDIGLLEKEIKEWQIQQQFEFEEILRANTTQYNGAVEHCRRLVQQRKQLKQEQSNTVGMSFIFYIAYTHIRITNLKNIYIYI